MLYFAYGSNMNRDQISERCPSARLIGKARLDHYRLAFTRVSARNWPGCGVADIVPEPASNVWGGLFEIADQDVPALDRMEGYRPGRRCNAYERVSAAVLRDGDPGEPSPAQSYVVCEPVEPNPIPHRDYVARIISGAEWIELPADYIAELRKIKVRP